MTVSVACDAATGSWDSTAKLFGGTTPFTLNNPTGALPEDYRDRHLHEPSGRRHGRSEPVGQHRYVIGEVRPREDECHVPGVVQREPAPAITWQYSLNGNFPSPTDPAPIFTGSSFSLSPAQASDSGFYRAVASNGLGTPSTSTPIQLEPSDLTLAFVQPTDERSQERALRA